MAPKKGKESPRELCTRATVLGNSISVRMLEYLSTVKNQPHGFRGLATNFLEICRILWSIEAGLEEASSMHNQLPVDMIQELDKKFRQANDDFIALNQMLSKFLEYEKKGGFGRLQKGFRMMFAESDIEKMRESLAKSREALNMSALVFRWSLGDVKADSSVGIGYIALAAALERMNHGSPTAVIPPVQTHVSEAPKLPPPDPPVSLAARTAMANLNSRHDEPLHALSADLDRQNFKHLRSPRFSKPSTNSVVRELTVHRNGSSHTGTLVDDNMSFKTTESMTQIEDMIHETDLYDKPSIQTIRLKADPTTVPRWAPKQTSGANSPALKTALTHAVQQKNHKMIEQLLDCGVPTEHGLEINLLREAVLNRDVESVRLLLLFGAGPDRVDTNGFTPLFSATEMSFLEGAKLLTKIPLAMAAAENKVEFVQLYLMYGGDANCVMANGNTAFVKAMNKTTSKKLVELMLNYGADPNAKNGEGKTPLFETIQASRLDLMTLLLDSGADPNLPGPKHLLWPSTYQPKALQLLLSRGADYKKCPGIMELAASINNMESISILLKAGVDPNAKKDGVYTPLCSAIRDNRIETVSLLLAHGADPNLMASEYPAFKCVTHNRTHLLPQLVAAGADLHNPKGIIEKAVAHNNKEALMYLLDQGVSPNDRSTEGYTPLTTAIRDDRSEFVDVLLANGVDPAVRGQDWPICMAIKRPAILKKLLPAVSNPRAVKGVIEQAVVANELESVKLLLQAGASVEDKTGGVFSPLTTAIREDRKDIVRFLLDEAGADPNAPGEHLPIIKAIRRYRGNDTEIIEMLLAHGADINLMYRGWNAVLQAVENGDANILRLLVEKGGGVDLQATDESGRTVIDIVTGRGWREAVTILNRK
ncbi:hypothetical protein H2199_004974 [Coniosporium tulheliwenetii]|uniref:Uncharacterized protein n=1 Tax=Coniosporium tulheliwenetii TaxID=3383036 RepID=A0ACC2Z378_9PEZI|nr:hypothetical protein H2199_004974 [Cladosporium sp. JES 115]